MNYQYQFIEFRIAALQIHFTVATELCNSLAAYQNREDEWVVIFTKNGKWGGVDRTESRIGGTHFLMGAMLSRSLACS